MLWQSNESMMRVRVTEWCTYMICTHHRMFTSIRVQIMWHLLFMRFIAIFFSLLFSQHRWWYKSARLKHLSAVMKDLSAKLKHLSAVLKDLSIQVLSLMMRDRFKFIWIHWISKYYIISRIFVPTTEISTPQSEHCCLLLPQNWGFQLGF